MFLFICQLLEQRDKALAVASQKCTFTVKLFTFVNYLTILICLTLK